MKKVGIITIIDYQNLGNRLQNFALQEFLKQYNLEVVTIRNNPLDKKNFIKRLSNLMKYNLIEIAILFINKFRDIFMKTDLDRKNNDLVNIRYSILKKFTENNIIESNFEITPKNIPSSLNQMFDYFIVGSDQVWNYNFRDCSPIDFLAFAEKDKRISFAASFGVENIPDIFIEKYKEWLAEFKNISVREQSGALLIKNIINREVLVLLDPTFLIDIKIWEKLSIASSSKPKCKFLLTYFLGEIDYINNQWIVNFANENDLKVVNLGDINYPAYYCEGPSEFLDFIQSCEMFMTDSFHGVVFSIIFNKPFIVFDRKDKAPSMGSRIDTILQKFDYEKRKFCLTMRADEVFNIDFSNVQSILCKEKKIAHEYICESIGIDLMTYEN